MHVWIEFTDATRVDYKYIVLMDTEKMDLLSVATKKDVVKKFQNGGNLCSK